MKKIKVINNKNLPTGFRPFTGIVTIWFLWDKFPQEWIRTLLITGTTFYLIAKIFLIITSERVDIFEEKKK